MLSKTFVFRFFFHIQLQFYIGSHTYLPTTGFLMSSAGIFLDFIKARDATGLQVYMLNEQALPDHVERNNRALFEACRDGAEKLCEVLICFGAAVNSAVIDQQTPVFIACKNAHLVCLDLMLSHGVDVNLGDLRYGLTPLMATAIEAVTPVGVTFVEFIDNRCRCMRALLAAGAAIDQTDKHGCNALMRAVWNFRLTEILIEFGPNVKKLNNYHDSALHTASERNDAFVVELLLELGADVDAVSGDGWVPLHCACNFLNPTVVDSLLRHSADIDILTNYSQTILQFAMSRSATSPNRLAVLQLMSTCAQTRLEASLADWLRLARHERSGQQNGYILVCSYHHI